MKKFFAFMPTPERKKIREKRIIMLKGAYEMMRGRYWEIKANTYFSPSIASVAIEDYLVMRDGLINRDKIPGGIQWHKVAGLMASSIGKNKPIQLVPENTDSKSYRHSKDNEVLAALHGLAVCAEGKNESHMESIFKVSNFHRWFDDFIHVLHNNPSNSEAFILAFETLSLTYFPDNLGHFE